MNEQDAKTNWNNFLNDLDAICEICEEDKAEQTIDGFIACNGCAGSITVINTRLSFFCKTGHFPELETKNVPPAELASEEWF